MDRCGFWNVRGMNSHAKQREIKWFLDKNNVDLFGLLETKVSSVSLNKVGSVVCEGWSLCTNSSCHKGGRIWLLWKPHKLVVHVLHVASQCIVAEVLDRVSQCKFLISMVYAFNALADRVSLWEDLSSFKGYTGPWLVCGDFNNVLFLTERLGAEVHLSETEPFRRCVEECELSDIKSIGAFFTWNNKQAGVKRVFSRIDRVLVNGAWLSDFPDWYAHFLPEGVFDHCPCVIQSAEAQFRKSGSFKYYNMWSMAPEFPTIVRERWSKEIRGHTMFQVVSKLKQLKKDLRGLNKGLFSNIEHSADMAVQLLLQRQIALQNNPTDCGLILAESEAANSARFLLEAKHRFLIQRSKAKWAHEGDENTAFFHSCIKERRQHNRVVLIKDIDGGVATTNASIQTAFLQYYTHLLGTSAKVDPVHVNTVKRGHCVREDQWAAMLSVPSAQEIKEAMFSIDDAKAPGPDGYSSRFFKDTWDVIGRDVLQAVRSFFLNGKLLQQVNNTTLVLIPKVDSPVDVKDFRPIACCNVIYKCISKLLCAKLTEVLPGIISESQTAFIKGRSILDNILVCQDLVKLYSRKACSPRAILKLDLQKAYDSIEWRFIEELLDALNFPKLFSAWILTCITSPTFTLSLNGELFGHFKGQRGLRQGDPMSPLIFTICMEYLSRILEVATTRPGFSFHPMCKRLSLSHLCFADDLLLFARGDYQSVHRLLCAFESFSRASGLKMNKGKSAIYMNGVPDEAKSPMLRYGGLVEGTLPFRYLGVPISPTKLSRKECLKLSERITKRIHGWGSRKLSYAGRLCLVNSVLNNLHSYWSSVFLLPVATLNSIINVCRNYLWEGSEEYGRAPLVA
ncbi:hypothetical protein vseg_015413 [Gypsophila vaccaria]